MLTLAGGAKVQGRLVGASFGVNALPIAAVVCGWNQNKIN